MIRRQHRRSTTTARARLLRLVILSIAAFAAPAIATADTIHLKNGRVIHTARTRVENGMLVFSQLGGTVSIPMSTVERVERNANVESAAAAMPETAFAAAATRRAAAAYPWDHAEYWGERLMEIERRIERVDNELARLPVYSEFDQQIIVSGQIMYFVAERAQWEGLRTRLVQLRDELERGARKAGITPGALRKARQR